MLYYATVTGKSDAGVQITGSHNPPQYNGLKVMAKGKAFYGQDILALGQIAAKGEYASGKGSDREIKIFDDYIARLASDYTSPVDMAIGWDFGNGSAGPAMKALTEKLPGRHVLLYEDVDGTFPHHHPDPTLPENLVDLQNSVAKEKLDLGIAFDGDGDRIGVVDGKGRILWATS